jgi:hypothetical protein
MSLMSKEQGNYKFQFTKWAEQLKILWDIDLDSDFIELTKELKVTWI